MNDPSQNLPWRVHPPTGSPLWVVEDSAGNFVFASASEALARMVAAGSVAGALYAVCEKAQFACQDNLKMYTYKNEPLLLEAFEACKTALASAAPLLDPAQEAP